MTSSNAFGRGEDRTELDGIQRQINERTNQSLESTRRMIGMVAESQEVGTKTMVMLDEQGEQLNRIEVNPFLILLASFHSFHSEWCGSNPCGNESSRKKHKQSTKMLRSLCSSMESCAAYTSSIIQ